MACAPIKTRPLQKSFLRPCLWSGGEGWEGGGGVICVKPRLRSNWVTASWIQFNSDHFSQDLKNLKENEDWRLSQFDNFVTACYTNDCVGTLMS